MTALHSCSLINSTLINTQSYQLCTQHFGRKALFVRVLTLHDQRSFRKLGWGSLVVREIFTAKSQIPTFILSWQFLLQC